MAHFRDGVSHFFNYIFLGNRKTNTKHTTNNAILTYILVCNPSENACAFDAAVVLPSVLKNTDPTIAIPNEEPTRCAVLNIPLAPPRSGPATVESVKPFNGAIIKPLPSPAVNNGKVSHHAENTPSWI